MNLAYEKYSYEPYIQPIISIFKKTCTHFCLTVLLHFSFYVLLIMTSALMLTDSEGNEKSAIDLSDLYNTKPFLFWPLVFERDQETRILSLNWLPP